MKQFVIEFEKVVIVMLSTLLLIILVLRIFGLWQYDDDAFYVHQDWTFTVYNGTYNPLLESLSTLQFPVILLLPFLLLAFRKWLRVPVAPYAGVVLALIILLPLSSVLQWPPPKAGLIDRTLESELPLYLPVEALVVGISTIGWIGGYGYNKWREKKPLSKE